MEKYNLYEKQYQDSKKKTFSLLYLTIEDSLQFRDKTKGKLISKLNLIK